MQGFIISSFIESMLKVINRKFNIEDIFSYADDIAICVYSVDKYFQAINIISKWSNEAGIPINFRKIGILNIIMNTITHNIAIGNNCMNYPIVNNISIWEYVWMRNLTLKHSLNLINQRLIT